MSFAVQKVKIPISHTIEFDVNGGDSISYASRTYSIGGKYGSFPTATKTGMIIAGWYTQAVGGTKINTSDSVDFRITKLYAQYKVMTNFTSFEVTTTASYKKFGIYSATLKSGSTSVIIDWGDGSVEECSQISQKVHEYSSIGTFIVKISDDLSSISVSTNDSTWYSTTSNIRYTLRKILHYSTSITLIPQYAYYYCYNMTSVYGISDSNITQLPNHCFYYCYNIQSLNGLSKITSIGTYCFYYCQNLTSFTGLGNITTLPNYSFYQCNKISSLDTLPTTVSSYGQYCLGYTKISDLSRIRTTDTLSLYCFANLNSLSSIATLQPRPNLPTYCFYNNTGIKTLDFSNWTSLTSIPSYCFNTNSNLTSIVFGTKIKTINTYAFQQCYKLNTINLKDTQVNSLNNSAFHYCYGLTSMSLPSTLTAIYYSALAGCYNLKEISCYAANAPTTYSSTFGTTDANYTNAYVGRNVKAAGNNKLFVENYDNYNTSYWKSVLLDSSKCGYNLVTLDEYDIRGCKVEGINKAYAYTGEPIVPEPIVKNSSGTTLTKGTHYSTSYENNVECGTATLSISGLTPYHGTKTINFIIYDHSRRWLSVDVNSQWRTPPQAWTNTDSDYDVYESFSNYNVGNGYARMYINLSGYTEFTISINSYAESSYDYTIAFDVDKDVTSLPTKDTTGALASTYGYQYNPSQYPISGGTGWKQVTYALDGGQHRIMICYRKDSSVNNGYDRGYVAIKKDQYPQSN